MKGWECRKCHTHFNEFTLHETDDDCWEWRCPACEHVHGGISNEGGLDLGIAAEEGKPVEPATEGG